MMRPGGWIRGSLSGLLAGTAKVALTTALVLTAGLTAAPAQQALAAVRPAATADATPPIQSKRVALVVGNSDYTSLPALRNPVNDVREVVRTLRSAGFEVIHGVNLTRIQFEELLKTYLRSMDGADVSLVYYSGHGIQIGRRNYLVPVDAKLSTPYDVEIETVSLENLYGYLKEHSRMQLLFLDACRDNPFRTDQFWIADRREAVSNVRGLAPPPRIRAVTRQGDSLGSLFAFATAPDQVAYDGAGDLSHYTQAFVRRALIPNAEIRQVLTRVRNDVTSATRGQQTPWDESSLTDDFFMVRLPSAPVVSGLQRVSVRVGQGPAALELTPPASPAGSPVQITFDGLPERGRLLVRGSPLAAGRPLQVADLAHLQFDPRDAPAGHVELMSYTVTDGWQQGSRGAIAVAVTAAEVARAPETAPSGTRSTGGRQAQAAPAPDDRAERDRALHAYVSGLQRVTAQIPVGLGPVPLGLPAARVAADEAASVTFTAVPASGVVRAGDARIEVGTTLPVRDLAALTFEPQIGTEGQPLSIGMALETNRQRTAVATTVRPVLHACDREAGEPFDLQGTSPGRLPNEIQPQSAIRACQEAMQRFPNQPRFQFQLGRAQLAARQVEEGWRSVEAAAGRGHVRALYQLGYLTRLGLGGRAPDLAKAAEYFQQGADRGDPYGIYDYGKALFYGLGVQQDIGTGLRLMLRAADLGHTYAMNELGFIFLRGRSVAQDAERGIRFYRSGAERNDIYSLANLGLAYLNGDGVQNNIQQALRYLRQADQGGHPYAPFYLGRMHRDGVGVQRNPSQAAALFERGAERGDYWAALERGFVAVNGPSQMRDGGTAAYFFALASSLNRPNVGDAENRARKALDDLPASAKAAAERRLRQELGMPSSRSSDQDVGDNLVRLARQAWERRNPRIDLF